MAQNNIKNSFKGNRQAGTGFDPVHAAIIVIFTFIIYFNAIFNGFIRDDYAEVLMDPWIRDFAHLKPIFMLNFWGFIGKLSSYYRPMKGVVYVLLYSVFGTSPWGWHLVNILLHAVNSVLVYEVALLITAGAQPVNARPVRFLPDARKAGALATGLIFAAHPVHVESVAWVAGFSDTLPTFFLLSAFIVFIKLSGRSSGRSGYFIYFFSEFFLLLAGFLSKESAFLVPAGFIAYGLLIKDGEGGDRTAAALIKKYLPFALAWAAYVGLRIHAVGSFTGPALHPPIPLSTNVFTVLSFFALYVLKIFFPFRLNAGYSYGFVSSVFSAQFLICALVDVLFAVCMFIYLKRDRRFFLYGLIFFLAILPALDLYGLYDLLFADRYLYIPSIGFALAAGLAVQKSFPRWNSAIIAALAALLVFYGASTVMRNLVWKDNLSVWADAASKSPEDPYVLEQYGQELQKKGDVATAVKVYGRAADNLGSGPTLNSTVILDKYGLALMENGDFEKAVGVFLKAISMNPGIPELHYNLAKDYEILNEPGDAIAQYRVGIKEKPSAAACRELADLLCHSGDNAGADQFYRQAVLMGNSAGPSSCK